MIVLASANSCSASDTSTRRKSRSNARIAAKASVSPGLWPSTASCTWRTRRTSATSAAEASTNEVESEDPSADPHRHQAVRVRRSQLPEGLQTQLRPQKTPTHALLGRQQLLRGRLLRRRVPALAPAGGVRGDRRRELNLWLAVVCPPLSRAFRSRVH